MTRVVIRLKELVLRGILVLNITLIVLVIRSFPSNLPAKNDDEYNDSEYTRSDYRAKDDSFRIFRFISHIRDREGDEDVENPSDIAFQFPCLCGCVSNKAWY